MSYFERSKRTKSARTARTWTDGPLTNQQKASLSMAARQAFDAHDRAGLVDQPFDDWRHDQTKIACGKASLRDATQQNFRAILGHFQRLAGKEAEAAKTWSKTGRVKGSTEVHDTHENREVAKHALRSLIAASNGAVTVDDCESICRDKSNGAGLEEATAKQLQEVLFTARRWARKKGGHV